jgi:ssDNA-binding Zn-finger/Zn-ribbon topoisomerase 1
VAEVSDEIQLWPEKPKPAEAPKETKPAHHFEWAVGYCPDCGGMVVKGSDKIDFSQLLQAVHKLYHRKLADSAYECKTCHRPLPAKTKEEAEKLEACPWCGGTQAVPRTGGK